MAVDGDEYRTKANIRRCFIIFLGPYPVIAIVSLYLPAWSRRGSRNFMLPIKHPLYTSSMHCFPSIIIEHCRLLSNRPHPVVAQGFTHNPTMEAHAA